MTFLITYLIVIIQMTFAYLRLIDKTQLTMTMMMIVRLD